MGMEVIRAADYDELSVCAGGYDVYKSWQTVREQPTEIAEMIIEYVLSHGSITVDRTRWLKVIY